METETFFPTSTPALSTNPQASYGELVDFWNANHSRIPELEKQIAELKNENERYAASLYRNRVAVSNLETQLKALFQDGDIDEETACALAEPFDIRLGEELEVCITVTYRGTAIVPFAMNPADIDWSNELSFSFDPYNSEIEFDLYEDEVEAEVM